MDYESLRHHCRDDLEGSFETIDTILENHGFRSQNGSFYLGDQEVNAVTCVLAALDLSRQLPWFTSSVRDIRMLRIEELNDLMPAVQQGQSEG